MCINSKLVLELKLKPIYTKYPSDQSVQNRQGIQIRQVEFDTDFSIGTIFKLSLHRILINSQFCLYRYYMYQLSTCVYLWALKIVPS